MAGHYRPERDKETLSKALSRILRYEAKERGLYLDGENFVPVDQVAREVRNITQTELEEVVAWSRDRCGSARFEFARRPDPNGDLMQMIRASRSYPAAFPRLSRSYPAAIPRLSRSYPAAIPQLSRSYPAGIPQLSRSYPAAIPRLSRSYPALSRSYPAGIPQLSRTILLLSRSDPAAIP